MALLKDEVVLTLGGDALRITENYEIKAAILTQPAAFSIRLGHGGVVADLLKRYPENTPFQLSINDHQIQTGYTDGLATGGSGATQITFDGRDQLAEVIQSCVHRDRSFANITFRDLTAAVFDEIGVRDYTIISDNLANRRAITGTQTVQTKPAEIEIETFTKKEAEIRKVVQGTSKTTTKSENVKIGTRWYDWLKSHYDRAGLFLWTTGAGDYVLSAPNSNQEPAYRITRIRRGERGLGKVVTHHHRRNIAQRYTKVVVYGRGGGKGQGRTKTRGEFVNEEVARILGGEDRRVLTVHDNDCKSNKDCEYLARRRVAEMNRDGWSLLYTLAGHSTEALKGGGRAVWAQDTVVEVDDRELGIQGLFYIENVTFSRSPATTATVHLMRPTDMVFALERQ
jgi:prophage tail gpP-like protein